MLLGGGGKDAFLSFNSWGYLLSTTKTKKREKKKKKWLFVIHILGSYFPPIVSDSLPFILSCFFFLAHCAATLFRVQRADKGDNSFDNEGTQIATGFFSNKREK